MEEKDRPAESQIRVEQPVKITEADLHLLVADLQDDISSYRKREAAWLSLVVHGVVILLLVFIPKWIGLRPMIVPIQKQETTFLALPDDVQKVKTPKTNILSDKNRIAQTNTPSKEALRKLLDARKAGAPKAPAPPPQPTQQAAEQNPATQQAPPPPQQAQPQPPPPANSAQLQQPPGPKKNPFAISSGTTVSDAIHAVANGHANPKVEFGGGSGGEYGSAVHPKTDNRGGLEILSDTMGVDFGPYMKRLRYTVQNHWDPLIPESAMPPVMKKGVVVVEFAITKDGRVMGMKLISGSGDVALDRAAWGAITDAIPLPNLPTQFAGDYLLIRARFYYNPDKSDLE
jgi:TonB family protein